MEYRYKCIRSKQTKSGEWLAQFSAPAPDIDDWAGVPQKTQFEFGGETVGFQRDESRKRVDKLGEFCETPENIIQNPLLCALRHDVEFVPQGEEDSDGEVPPVQVGELVVSVPDFASYSVEVCLSGVREYLEERDPSLADATPDAELVRRLREKVADPASADESDDGDGGVDDDAEDNDEDSSEANGATGALYEDSHIADFWLQVAARHEVAKESSPTFDERDEYLGFSKDAMLSYLRPVVLVDGQHRLRGAIRAAQERLGDEDVLSESDRRIAEGKTVEEVERELLREESRLLPISLLMSKSPEEQVFQFVVVNQKATPVGKALLGTIISTTLSDDEMERVANRLKDAGIEVEESRAITYLARSDDSPFKGLIDRGIRRAGEPAQGRLQWNVVASLVSIFRNLSGGRMYHGTVDHAREWRKANLDSSSIVANYAQHNCRDPMAYWSSLDGPWRTVFIAFWNEIRRILGDEVDSERPNFWGNARKSNLFNKISLTILAVDFFQWLSMSGDRIDSEEDIPLLIERWLAKVNRKYFDRNWPLGGIKKDSVGTRNQWSYLWEEHRKGMNLPKLLSYRNPRLV